MHFDTHILPDFLQQHLLAIQTLCKSHKVKQLWVFGSVLRPDFSATSDVDCLYEMDDQHIAEDEWYGAFWGFLDALEHLLQRKVDIIWYSGIKNPYFKEEVDETKVLIYEQKAPSAFAPLWRQNAMPHAHS